MPRSRRACGWRSGRQDALEERLFRATFTEGEAVAEHDVLARLAAEVGLSGAQSPDVLLEVLERAWQDRAPLSLSGAGASGPGCDADGCSG